MINYSSYTLNAENLVPRVVQKYAKFANTPPPQKSRVYLWFSNLLIIKNHESGLSFNPERHFKLNLCLHGRLSLGLKDHGEWKSHSGLKLVSHSCTDNLTSGDFSTYTLKYVNKTSHFANNLYFGHSERRFHSDFHFDVKFQSKFTWFRINISFRIECSIRNEKWHELDPEWVATQSWFM